MTIKLMQEVYDGLEEVRESGAYNMFYDRQGVISELVYQGYDKAARWVRNNPKTYGRLIMEGPEVSDICDTD